MLNAKHKKIIFSFTAAAVMSMGGVTAFAATSGITLTPVSNVDVSKINVQKAELKADGKVDPKVLEKLSKIKVQKGELTVVGKVDSEVLKNVKDAKITTAPAKNIKK
jgi:hypothetical protein